jgi:hypothetical protein
MLYLSLQLERSHLPQYTRSALEVRDGEGFLLRSLWRGVFMIPEQLSNFIYVRPKPELKLIQTKVEETKIEKKKEKLDAPKISPPPKVFIPPPKRIEVSQQIQPPSLSPNRSFEIPMMPKIQLPEEIVPPQNSRNINQGPPV